MLLLMSRGSMQKMPEKYTTSYEDKQLIEGSDTSCLGQSALILLPSRLEKISRARKKEKCRMEERKYLVSIDGKT